MALPFIGSALHDFPNFLANLVAKTHAQAVRQPGERPIIGGPVQELELLALFWAARFIQQDFTVLCQGPLVFVKWVAFIQVNRGQYARPK